MKKISQMADMQCFCNMADKRGLASGSTFMAVYTCRNMYNKRKTSARLFLGQTSRLHSGSVNSWSGWPVIVGWRNEHFAQVCWGFHFQGVSKLDRQASAASPSKLLRCRTLATLINSFMSLFLYSPIELLENKAGFFSLK